jgi:trehalose-6-phosphatase
MVQRRGPEGEEAQVLPLELDSGLLATMATVRNEAHAAACAVPGATVEDNLYSVSVHFRNCAVEDYDKVCSHL